MVVPSKIKSNFTEFIYLINGSSDLKVKFLVKAHNCFMHENWKLTKFLLQIDLCIPDYLIRLSPTKYNLSFLS